jgi:hypothetical protein
MATNNKRIPCGGGPKYPEETYFTIIFSEDSRDLTHLIPLHFVSENIYEISHLIKQMEVKSQSDLRISQNAILVPLKLDSLLPVRQNSCKNKACIYSKWYRMKAFLELLKSPSFYNIMVLPSFYINKKWHFLAEFPFSITSSNKVYEYYFKHSSPLLNNDIQYFALYSCSKPIVYNWKKDLQESSLLKSKQAINIKNDL